MGRSAGSLVTFIVATLFLSALSLFILEKLQPTVRSFNTNGIVIRIEKNEIEIKPISGKRILVKNIDNLDVYREILENFRAKNETAEIEWREYIFLNGGKETRIIWVSVVHLGKNGALSDD